MPLRGSSPIYLVVYSMPAPIGTQQALSNTLLAILWEAIHHYVADTASFECSQFLCGSFCEVKTPFPVPFSAHLEHYRQN